MVGGDYEKEEEAINNAATTSDGGKTWTLSKGLSGFRSAIAYLPGSKATWIAVGPRGVDLTLDDGRTWKAIGTGGGFHTFSFAPRGRRGWGAGDRGVIARIEGF